MRQSLRINQYIFQSTLSVRRATRAASVHRRVEEISIHALRKESDDRASDSPTHPNRFQSTLSVRRATVNHHNTSISSLFQSTLSVRRATTPFSRAAALPEFQSTLSVRRATFAEREHVSRLFISIHALRKESDAP